MLRTFVTAAMLVTLGTTIALGQNAADTSPSATKEDDWKFEAYPVLLWAPVFGADVTLPTFPNAPDIPGQPGPSSSVSSNFNGAAAAGFRMEYKKWSLDTDALWAGMSGTRETPLTKVDVDMVLGGLRGGYQVRKHLWVEAGFRRLAFNISAKIGSLPEVSRKPGVWDPLIGLSYRRSLGKSWTIKLLADGGGFGAGTSADISGRAEAQWRFGGHFGLTMGYGMLYIKLNSRQNLQTLALEQTLHGPIIGFGIYF